MGAGKMEGEGWGGLWYGRDAWCGVDMVWVWHSSCVVVVVSGRGLWCGCRGYSVGWVWMEEGMVGHVV